MISLSSHTAAFADFHCHTAADIIARCKILVMGRITLHEALPFGIRKIPPLSAGAFGNQTPRSIDACWMELHKFHILQWKARARHHATTVSSTGMCGCGRKIGTPISTSGKNHHLCIKDMHGAVIKFPTQHPLTGAILGHDEVDCEILNVKFSIIFQRLPIKRMQDGVTCAVSCGASALHGRAFTKFCGMASERTLVNFSLFSA